MMRHLPSSKEWWQDVQTTSPAEIPAEHFWSMVLYVLKAESDAKYENGQKSR